MVQKITLSVPLSIYSLNERKWRGGQLRIQAAGIIKSSCYQYFDRVFLFIQREELQSREENMIPSFTEVIGVFRVILFVFLLRHMLLDLPIPELPIPSLPVQSTQANQECVQA